MRSKFGACVLRVERIMVCLLYQYVCRIDFSFLLHVFYKLHAPHSTLHLSKRSFFIVNSNMGAI